jgi:membrane protease YdiL (CAAX protease family)
MIGSFVGSAARGREEAFAWGAIALGLAALATRQVSYAALATTAVVGGAGLLVPVAGERPRVSARDRALATGLGLAAFAFVRILVAAPAGPAGPLAALATGLAGAAEEAFFRRLLFGRLARRGASLAVWGSAVAFALVHVPLYGWRALPLDLAAGLVLGWQRLATGTWTAPALTHFAANVMASL